MVRTDVRCSFVPRIAWGAERAVRAATLWLIAMALGAGAAPVVPARTADRDAAAPVALERRVDAAAGETLEVDLLGGGSIVVHGGAEGTVRVRIAGADPSAVAVERRGDRVIVSGDRDAGPSLTIEIEVPSRFNLQLSTAGGDLRVDGVDGRLSGDTLGGAIELVGLAGEVDVSTLGGPVWLGKSRVDGRLRSQGGEVRLSDVEGRIDASTLGGDIVVAGHSGGRYELITSGGDVAVAEAPPDSLLKTLGGSIRVDRALGALRAETLGGNIRVDEAAGSLQATTLGGTVRARVVGRPERVRVVARQGDVTLILPLAISARFEIDVAWTRTSSGDYDVVSDFPLDVRPATGWEVDGGEPRRYVAASGRAGDGACEIRVETLNGGVRIVRGD